MVSKHAQAAEKRLIDVTWSVWDACESMAARMLDVTEADGLEETVGATLTLIVAIDSREAELKAEQDELAKQRKELAAAREKLKDALIEVHHETGCDITSDYHTAGVGKGRPAVVVTDLNRLPAGMTRIKVEADKEAIATAIKAGQQVEGAMLSNSPPSLIIRARSK